MRFTTVRQALQLILWVKNLNTGIEIVVHIQTWHINAPMFGTMFECVHKVKKEWQKKKKKKRKKHLGNSVKYHIG